MHISLALLALTMPCVHLYLVAFACLHRAVPYLAPGVAQDKIAGLSGVAAGSLDLFTVSTGARLRATKIEKKQSHGV